LALDVKTLKRKKIIETAAKEFAEKGFENANINEIATMSGIGKGSIYLYFKTKKELYLATMEAVVEYFNDASEKIMKLDCSVKEKLKLCIESLFLFEKESYPFLILWSRYQFQNNPDFQEEVFLIYEDLQQPFCQIVKEGVEQGIFSTPYPEASGYLILSMITMLLPSLQPKPLLESESIEDKVTYILGFVEKGIRKNELGQ
jgi:AcrR family transcriptional regulator